jgi:hypothetical protein
MKTRSAFRKRDKKATRRASAMPFGQGIYRRATNQAKQGQRALIVGTFFIAQ